MAQLPLDQDALNNPTNPENVVSRVFATFGSSLNNFQEPELTPADRLEATADSTIAASDPGLSPESQSSMVRTKIVDASAERVAEKAERDALLGPESQVPGALETLPPPVATQADLEAREEQLKLFLEGGKAQAIANGFSKKAAEAMEADVISASKNSDRIAQLARIFNPSFGTIPGEIGLTVGRLFERLGAGPGSPGFQELVKQRQEFNRLSNSLVLETKKAISGTASSDKETKDIQGITLKLAESAAQAALGDGQIPTEAIDTLKLLQRLNNNKIAKDVLMVELGGPNKKLNSQIPLFGGDVAKRMQDIADADGLVTEQEVADRFGLVWDGQPTPIGMTVSAYLIAGGRTVLELDADVDRPIPAPEDIADLQEAFAAGDETVVEEFDSFFGPLAADRALSGSQ